MSKSYDFESSNILNSSGNIKQLSWSSIKTKIVKGHKTPKQNSLLLKDHQELLKKIEPATNPNLPTQRLLFGSPNASYSWLNKNEESVRRSEVRGLDLTPQKETSSIIEKEKEEDVKPDDEAHH